MVSTNNPGKYRLCEEHPIAAKLVPQKSNIGNSIALWLIVAGVLVISICSIITMFSVLSFVSGATGPVQVKLSTR